MAEERPLNAAEEALNIVNGDGDKDRPSVDEASPVTVAASGASLKRDADAAGLPQISKNQLKKLRRKQEWEDGREGRKLKRKDKMQQKRAQKRAEYEEKHADDPPEVVAAIKAQQQQQSKPYVRPTQLPITFIFDCQFDSLMSDGEITSLGSQLTRCYADNKKARFRAHLALSSFGGKLKERFDGILESHYKNWNGVRFLEEDFVRTAESAKGWMKEEGGGAVAGALAKPAGTDAVEDAGNGEGEVIYLSSDSPDTLTELKPYTTYIIGALVDKNRHKGICYKRAAEAGIKTAKLPIGDYLHMQSRKVLTTNHVNEIMLKWLELGDWGEAFIQVIPKRKGGALRQSGEETAKEDDGDGKAAEDEDSDGGADLISGEGGEA